MAPTEIGQGCCRACGPDPLGGDLTDPQSLNRYAYALNNPTTLTDPSGLDPLEDECGPDYCPGGGFIGAGGGGGGTGGGGSNGGGSNGGGGGETLPPAAGNPNGPAGPLQSSGPFGPGRPCDFDSCVIAGNPFTAQVGASVNLTLPWWGITFTYFAGVAVDLHGHVAFYHGYGGGLGAGAGASGGVQFGVSNADTVCGLGGPFDAGSGTLGGEGAAGTVDVFQGSGNGPGGVVTGGTVTLGVGGGASTSVGATTTTVVPAGNYSCKP